MAAKPNLDQGNTAAKAKNSPAPLARQKRANLDQTKTDAKPRNVPSPYAKNREAQTYRPGRSDKPEALPDEGRIRNELLTRKHPTQHSRKGR